MKGERELGEGSVKAAGLGRTGDRVHLEAVASARGWWGTLGNTSSQTGGGVLCTSWGKRPGMLANMLQYQDAPQHRIILHNVFLVWMCRKPGFS